MAIREEVFYEGGPHIGDLIINILVGFTVLGIPLTVGAIARALWLRYRITNRRLTIVGGWMGRDRWDVIYKEIKKIIAVPRGLGAWGDMVVTLQDGTRLEMRAVPKFREVEAYLRQQAKLDPADTAVKA